MIKVSCIASLIGATALLISCGSAADSDNDLATSDVIEDSEVLTVENQPGPAIGDRAPVDLELADADGNNLAVSARTGQKGTVLVFTRSVDWCPYCQSQLKLLNEIAGDLSDKGYTVAGVSYDPVQSLKEFAEEQDIGYTLLSDDGSKLIDAFSIRDPQYADPESRAYGVPYASIFVLDSEGVVRAKSVSSDYKVRPTNEELNLLIEVAG